MKYYKIAVADITKVKGKFSVVGESEGFVYVAGEGLQEPFFEAKMPLELEKQMEEKLNYKRGVLLGEAKNVIAKEILSFRSNALGSTHEYEFELKDQINLNALLFLDETVGIVCKDSSGLRVRRNHAPAEIKEVYRDAIRHKELLRLEYANYKAELLRIEVESDLFAFGEKQE